MQNDPKKFMNFKQLFSCGPIIINRIIKCVALREMSAPKSSYIQKSGVH